MRGIAVLLLLAACGTGPDDASDAAIANRAESLERAADASTDQMIGEIEAQSNADLAADAPAAVSNGSTNLAD